MTFKPEVMSPVGHWPQLHAAIASGADAVYFGLTHFTARAKVGFTLAELPEAMRTLHRRGLKGYVTYNSLIFDAELDQAARGLAAIAESGVDAIIVQDLAVVKLAREIAPGLAIFGSTQMSITDAAGVRAAQTLGVSRVVLARELSLDEIAAIRKQTDCELEVFVHGALCVSYSGQCFSSEAWGGRSANRGQGAQACRLPYEMIVDGKVRPLGDARYLLSPGDLYALHQVPQLVAAGVHALKIEGRYKDEEYVALTTQAYRKAVDEACAGVPLSVDAAEELQLEQVYSRGLGPFFMTGTNHQAVVDGRSPRHRGVRIGRVRGVSPHSITMEPAEAHGIAPLKPGDGVVFDAADWRSPQEPEEGGRLFQVEPVPGGLLELRFANGALKSARIHPGDLVWRTDDPGTSRAARGIIGAASPVYRQAVNVRAEASPGMPLVLHWRLDSDPGVVVTVASEESLGPAQNRELSVDFLREQLGRLGNTPYRLDKVELDAPAPVFAPGSVLNALRREAVELLQSLQSRAPELRLREPAEVLAEMTPTLRHVQDAEPRLHLLVRSPEQLEAAIAARPTSVTLDYLDLYGLRPSLERVKASGIEARVASPRVLKPGEERIANFLLGCECPILVRSAGLLDMLRTGEPRSLTGDFSLNAANAISAHDLLERGLDRLTPSHDLNALQIVELARRSGASRIEVVAYHHLPVFHTEHCVFCRFLSTGTSYRDCGRPCESHKVALRDDSGRSHPVLADVGCRNTVFGSEAQQGALRMEEWLDAGIRHFRLEFVHESGEMVAAIARAFDETLQRRRTPASLLERLKQLAPAGVTEGSLFVPDGSFRLPVLQ